MAKQNPQKIRLANMLAKVPLFSGVDKEDLMDVVDAGREVNFESGKTIMKQGDLGIGFLLILEGKVEVRKKGKVVAKIVPGGFFGEMTMIDDKPRSADIVAIEPTTCFGLTEWAFFPVLRNNPSVAIGIIRELVRRLRQFEDNPTS